VKAPLSHRALALVATLFYGSTLVGHVFSEASKVAGLLYAVAAIAQAIVHYHAGEKH